MKKAVEAVLQAEEKIRTLIGEAAARGGYKSVRRLSTAAERLVTIREELGGDDTIPGPSKSTSPRRRVRSKQSGRKSKPPGYPRFERHGDVVYRIGWSKKSSREYEHKLPKAVFDQAVKAIATVADQAEEWFAAEDVIAETEHDGNAIPSYQVYVTLALLREAAVLERHGRNGYSVTVLNFPGGADMAWTQVQES